MSAIAEEIGFNNAQTFSSAFYKKTGIYPSYFINQLNKRL
jgi:AraC-like DNA-binding protein